MSFGTRFARFFALHMSNGGSSRMNLRRRRFFPLSVALKTLAANSEEE